MNDAVQKAVRLLDNAVQYDGETVKVTRPAALQTEAMDRLVRLAVFGKTDDEREAARWLIWELGQEVGCRPASIHDLYMARGRGDCGGFTVPAMNLRVLGYETARAVFRA